MSKNKDRLYVALYVRGGVAKMPGGEDKYHWAFLAGPKTEKSDSVGHRMHARDKLVVTDNNPVMVWVYEHLHITLGQTARLLARIVVGKITDMDQLSIILKSVPVRGDDLGWNCVEWVKEALQLLGEDKVALGTKVTDWNTVRDAAMDYVGRKIAECRFDRTETTSDTSSSNFVPTYDLLIHEETQS